jgi:hypothetical protein
MKIGVFPICDNCYELQFNNQKIKQALSQDRPLPGIDWNINEQLKMLTMF